MKRILTTLSQKWPEYLLEILVITIGIYGAFILDNWNEERKNNVKQDAIIRNIHEEFKQNIILLEKIKTGHTISYQSGLWLKGQFPINPSEVDLDSVSFHILALLTNWTFDPIQGRIKWLVGSENFDLIKDKELQEAIISWEMTFEDYHEDEQAAYNFNEAHLFPYISMYFPFNINLKDPRVDLQELSSLRFEGMIENRVSNYLTNILYNDTHELERLEILIHKIVELTSTESSEISNQRP